MAGKHWNPGLDLGVRERVVTHGLSRPVCQCYSWKKVDREFSYVNHTGKLSLVPLSYFAFRQPTLNQQENQELEN